MVDSEPQSETEYSAVAEDEFKEYLSQLFEPTRRIITKLRWQD
jgi:hypothetical protein